MINKLRISSKFLLLSFISITALIGIGIYGLYNSHSTFQWVRQVYETANVIDENTKKIGFTLYELRGLSQTMVMAPDKRLQRELSQKQIAIIENLDNTLTEWERTIVSEKEQQIFQNLTTTWQQYKKLVNLTRDHALEGHHETAFINVSGPEEQQFQALFQQFSYWLKEEVTNATSVYAAANQNYAIARWTYIALVVFFTLLVMINCRLVAYSMTTPLLQLHKHLKIMAQGELMEEELKYQGADEIADIIWSLQQLKIGMKNTIEQANAIAAGNYDLEVTVLSKQSQVGRALSEMTHKLRVATTKNAQQDWLKSGQAQLSTRLSGEQNIVQLAENVINFLTPYLDAQVGAFYLLETGPETRLKIIATHAYTWRKHVTHEFKLGDGVVGQAALERKTIVITEPPAEYIYIQTGLGGSAPRAILVMPFLYEGELKGVIEVAAFRVFTTLQMDFLNQVMPTIAIAVNTATARTKMQELLQQTQTQAEELQTQTEELQTQQEELRQTNEELEERSRELERQREHIYNNNKDLEKAKQLVENKAQELELASKYKSEFLANMSHELRTPLNSLLILAQILAENKPGNLDQKQVEYARTIHSAGADLLALINDILDLSKVEAGKMEIHVEEVRLADLLEDLVAKFRPVAESKNLAFHQSVVDNLPTALYTDSQRLKQILNNLLSNAFKFTAQGEVKLEVRNSGVQEFSSLGVPETGDAKNFLAIHVTDSGIGIPRDKQQVVFEPFQQVDGSTSRRFGGTGLGLSISRQLARLLGGEIKLESQEGKGSTFTLYLPNRLPTSAAIKVSPTASTARLAPLGSDVPTQPPAPAPGLEPSGSEVSPPQTETPAELADDRSSLQPDDQFILIIEDDRNFLRILMELAHERNFKCVVAEDGKTGLQLATELKPTAILLDVNLPQIDGWNVMESLKSNSNTRHIPVHFMSASDYSKDAKKMGAIGHLLKPVNMEDISAAFKKIEQFAVQRVKNLLVVTDYQPRQQKIHALVVEEDIKTTFAVTTADAYQQLQTEPFDCIIIDVEVDNRSGINLLAQMSQRDDFSQIPVILYTDHELTPAEDKILQQYEDNLTVKAVRSPERLVDEVTLFLHQIETNLSKEKRQMLQMVHDKEAILAYKKVLVVDDDARNTFALATILEDKNMEVVIAENGKEALEMLAQHDDVDIVLMDIMMPEMNGYEAMQKIRAQEHFRKLPIIALTAKAMKGDKAKCIEAGANDYLTKPVDTNKLLSLMRVWLYR